MLNLHDIILYGYFIPFKAGQIPLMVERALTRIILCHVLVMICSAAHMLSGVV